MNPYVKWFGTGAIAAGAAITGGLCLSTGVNWYDLKSFKTSPAPPGHVVYGRSPLNTGAYCRFTSGKKPVTVVVLGNAPHPSPEYWLLQEDLSKTLNVNVVTFDRPGYCLSPVREENSALSIADHNAFVESLLESLDVKEGIMLVCHGSGCLYGAGLGSTLEERLIGTVFVEPHLSGATNEDAWSQLKKSLEANRMLSDIGIIRIMGMDYDGEDKRIHSLRINSYSDSTAWLTAVYELSGLASFLQSRKFELPRFPAVPTQLVWHDTWKLKSTASRMAAFEHLMREEMEPFCRLGSPVPVSIADASTRGMPEAALPLQSNDVGPDHVRIAHGKGHSLHMGSRASIIAAVQDVLAAAEKQGLVQLNE